MTKPQTYPTIPRFGRHLLLRLELLGFQVSGNKILYQHCAHRQTQAVMLSYAGIHHSYLAGPNILLVQNGDSNGYCPANSTPELFTDVKLALRYILSLLPAETLQESALSLAHLQIATKLPPKKKDYAERQEKIKKTNNTDFYLIDRIYQLIDTDENPYHMTSCVNPSNPTINLAPPGNYKIYLRMVNDIELQVSVGRPTDDDNSKVEPAKNFMHAHFNTLLASPEDVLNHVTELMSQLASKKKKAA